jgi:D-alanyl-D-alanine carboxypeptidase/D-alanyl-D-alanine-endopeptidase (penicillin-binding protein 4)
MKGIFQSLAAVAMLSWAASAQPPGSPLQQRIAAIMNRPEYVHARFGMEFRALDADRPAYQFNEQQFFVAASTTKLLTEGTALALLGPDYRFHTRVFRTGAIDAGGTLGGDLVLVAAGDPNLSNRIQPDGTLAFENQDHAYDSMPGGAHVVPGDPLAVIRELAAQVAGAGIKKVAGHIVVDASLFPEGERELGTDVVLSPIAVNDNLIDVTIASEAEGSAPRLSLSPATAYIHIANQIKTGPASVKTASIWFTDERQQDGTYSVTAQGSVPAASQFLRTYRVPEPSRFAQMVFVEALRDAGVSATADLNLKPADARLQPFYKPENQVAEHVSPPFTEEVKVTLKVSQNLHASMTPYILGAVLEKNRAEPLQAGFDLESQFLRNAGLDVSGASQSDGAGGDAFYTPDFMVHYLVYMAHQDAVFPAFLKALPVLGKDGTLWDIQTGSPAAGHVYAKTGTLARSDMLNRSLMITGKGIAGYLDRKDGRRLAFAAYMGMADGDPQTIMHQVGNVLGEIAAAAYDAPLEP